MIDTEEPPPQETMEEPQGQPYTLPKRAKPTPEELTTKRLARLNRQLPFSDEAEKGILSGILAAPSERLPDLLVKVKPAAFHHTANRIVFEIICEHEMKGRPLDIASLTLTLRDRGEIDKVGGPGGLSQLYSFIPVSAHYDFYVKVLLDKWLLRQHIAACAETMEKAYDHGSGQDETPVVGIIAAGEESVAKVLDQAQGRGDARKDILTSGQAINQWLDVFDRITSNPGQVLGHSTGFFDIDRAFHGLAPDQDGDLLLVSAFPGMGKTAFAISLAEHFAINLRVPVGMFMLEMGHIACHHRLVLGRAKVPVSVSRNGFIEDGVEGAISHAADDIRRAPFHWDQSTSIECAELRAAVQRMVRKNGVRIIIIDHFGQLKPSTPEGKRDKVIGQIEIMNTLHEIRRTFGVLVCLFSQLTKEGRERQQRNKPPTLGDIKGAGELVELPTHIILLHRPPEVVPWPALGEEKQEEWLRSTHGYRFDCPENWVDPSTMSGADAIAAADYGQHARAVIAKNRWGPTADDICLRFDPIHQRFLNRTPRLYSNNPKHRQVKLPGF